MMAPSPVTIRPFDRGARWPASTEPRRIHADVGEAEDAKRRVDHFRVHVELAQVGEDPTRLVPALDAVSPMDPRNAVPSHKLAPASDTEETIRYVPHNALALTGIH